MSALLLAVFVASLLGSLHCAGMCGGLVALYAGRGPGGRAGILPHLGYHGGRLVSYASVGALAGLLGTLLNRTAGELAGMQHAAALAAGVLMLLLGGVSLARALGLRLPAARGAIGGGRLTAMGARALRSVQAWSPARQALLIGLLTPLLPCGWLYLFAITAAGTGTAWGGAAVMAAFWAGAVPLLLGVGLGLGAALRRFQRLTPLVGAAALLLVGGLTVALRAQVPLAAPLPTLPLDASRERVQGADHHRLPCCGGHEPAR